jgi:hypothetical protein
VRTSRIVEVKKTNKEASSSSSSEDYLSPDVVIHESAMESTFDGPSDSMLVGDVPGVGVELLFLWLWLGGGVECEGRRASSFY